MRLPAAIGPINRVARSPNYKWWAYFSIAIGLFLTVLDQSGVNIALPRIAEKFDADIPTVQWISLSYVLSTSATLMPLGRLSDMLGRKLVYVTGFFVFVGAAALAGSANTFALIILAKVIQGVGSGAIQANGMAMITQVFPEQERGRALGLYMAIIGTGAITGPIVGGLLVTQLGWRSVFFASVPIGVVAIIAAVAVLRGGGGTGAGAPGTARQRFDWAGAAFSSAALVSFLLGITNAHELGWLSPPILIAFGLATLLVAAFIWWERRIDHPMLDMGFFRVSTFSFGVAARFLSFLGGTAVFFLMPFYIIQGLGYQASTAALFMLPGSACTALMGPIAGRLSENFGTRWLSVGAMASSTAGMALFSQLSTDSSPIHVIAGMVLTGTGMGAFSSTNTSAIMGSLSRQSYGIASAFLNLVRTFANLTGVAVGAAITAFTMASLGFEPSLADVGQSVDADGARAAFVLGLNRAFLVSTGLMLLALACAALRGEPVAYDDAGAGERERQEVTSETAG